MLFFKSEQQEEINQIIATGAAAAMTDTDIIYAEVDEWLSSSEYNGMLIAQQYYNNKSDIQKKLRLMANGLELKHRNNAKIENAFYRRLVDQIVGYLVSKAPSLTTDKDEYAAELAEIFDPLYWRAFRQAARDAVIKGRGWLAPYIDAEGKLRFHYIPAEQVIPVWEDAAHINQELAIRTYLVEQYSGKQKVIVRKVEVWTKQAVHYYVYADGRLLLDNDAAEPVTGHFTTGGGYAGAWGRVPLICLKHNDLEQSSLDIIKALIDEYNKLASVTADMLIDMPKSLIKTVGYGGEDKDGLLRNLQTAQVIDVREGGDVDFVKNEPQVDAVIAWLESQRKHIYAFAGGMDAQNDDVGNASGTALDFRYDGLDKAANIFENELQVSMISALWFVNEYLKLINSQNYHGEKVEILFNRDRIQDETSAINNCKASAGIVSQKTIVANHPWTKDVESELKALEEEAAAAQDAFAQSFPGQAPKGQQQTPGAVK